jgi:hypothetical protein
LKILFFENKMSWIHEIDKEETGCDGNKMLILLLDTFVVSKERSNSILTP